MTAILNKRQDVQGVIVAAESKISDMLGFKVNVSVRPIVVGADKEWLREIVCEACDTTWEEITSRTRKREVVRGRQLYCYFSRMHFKEMHKNIALEVGYYDHSDVIHAITAINDLLHTDDPTVTIPFHHIKKALKNEAQA